MPELPEVETVRAGLAGRVVGKEIAQIVVNKPKLVKNSQRVFRDALVGSSFSCIDRIGKLLIFVIASKSKSTPKSDCAKFLLIHLKMTGQLIYCDEETFVAGGHANSQKEKNDFAQNVQEEFCKPGKYTHVIFEFGDGDNLSGKLFFNDVRQFGYLKIVNEMELGKIKQNFGIEPGTPNFTWENFAQIFVGRKTNIKALLLNQKVISGLGNIYVDEILFCAKVLPTRKVTTLTIDEKEKIFRYTKSIIASAIKFGGTTFSDFRDVSGQKGNFAQQLKVYGHAGEFCAKCKTTKIQKIKLAGRGTHLCTNCQR